MTLTTPPAATTTDLPVTSAAPAPATLTRSATPRHFLMCPPTYFDVVYAINPWMDLSVPVDRDRALAQWDSLKAAYEAHGHRVDVIDPEPGLPDMVYAANGGTVVGGKALAARFTFPERQPEGVAYEAWFASAGAEHGLVSLGQASDTNEGEGDLLFAGDVLLAGTGFRTSRAAHEEAGRLLGVEVLTLELVDPRFYHLDTALAVLDTTGASPTIAYYPEAFSPASQEVLRERYPDAIVATETDAAVLGLNAVSDGLHVFLTDRATGMHAQLREHGYVPVGVDLSELLKGGGSVKCCTLELRPAVERTAAGETTREDRA
ncbi:dimethylargininase [Isoptericola variabilis]|uniref:Amidinotransferase n=1 Tax=Isoptericola variabilis (strain 225) TaxID=743718 RepID=F6FW78_ISOV2|nr:dimethylargininase [Isoptericola variabilis]AEG45622.1 amidinotransferase [Isoptericola variabilis 225]TWH25769.1 ornithine--oxo-acid transaminase [Isoptericola variabilis J7]